MMIIEKINSVDTYFLFCDSGKEIEFKVRDNKLVKNNFLIGTEINYIIESLQLENNFVNKKEARYKEIIEENNNLECSVKILREQEGLTHAKIGELLNMSHNTARKIYLGL